MEHDIPFGNSNRENETTFSDFPLFLGIFQWDEPTERVPFTAEPEIPGILTKWKAPNMFRCSRKFSVGKTQKVVFHLPSNRISQKIFVNGKQLRLPRWQGFLVLLPTMKLLFCIKATKEKQIKIDAALSNAKSEAP